MGTADACIFDGVLSPIQPLHSPKPQPPSVGLKWM